MCIFHTACVCCLWTSGLTEKEEANRQLQTGDGKLPNWEIEEDAHYALAAFCALATSLSKDVLDSLKSNGRDHDS